MSVEVSQALKEHIKSSIEEISDKNKLCVLFKIVMDNNPELYVNKQQKYMYINLSDVSEETIKLLNEKIQSYNAMIGKIEYKPYTDNSIKFGNYNAEEKQILEHLNYINDIKSNQEN